VFGGTLSQKANHTNLAVRDLVEVAADALADVRPGPAS